MKLCYMKCYMLYYMKFGRVSATPYYNYSLLCMLLLDIFMKLGRA